MENVSSSVNEEKLTLISDRAASIIVLVFWIFACGIISLFGIVGNVINIIVFVRMSLRDTVNISLLGLAIADLCSSILLIMIGLFYNPLFTSLDLTFVPAEVEYLSFGWPRLCFTRVISWITAFVAFERCLCITVPLKVKTFITPHRSVLVIVFIYALMAISILPTYISTKLGWKVDEFNNQTIFGFLLHEDRQRIDGIAFMIGVVLASSSFFCAFVCAVVLIFSLQRQSLKRTELTSDSSGAGGNASAPSKKESRDAKSRQACKMIFVITVIFIACYLPNNMLQITMAMVSDFNKGGYFANLNVVCWSISNTLEASNSSVNIIMYLLMSSRYKATFFTVFPSCAPRISS